MSLTMEVMQWGLDLLQENPERFGQTLFHPLQRDVFEDIRDLLLTLRNAEGPKDFYEFQRHLFESIYRLEEGES